MKKSKIKIALRHLSAALLFYIYIGYALIFISCSPRSGQRFPHVIIFSVDTLRADHLHCYGYPRETSPFLDRFSREAVLFENTVSQSPHTAPSYMTLFTSLMPDVHRVRNYFAGETALAPGIPTLAETLKRRGYLTVGVHGGGNVDPARGFSRGFDYYRDGFKLNNESRGELPPEIGRWLDRSLREKKPIFLFLHHYYCHSPYLYGPPSLRKRFLKEKAKGLMTGPGDLKGRVGGASREFWEGVDLADPAQRSHIVALYDRGVLITDRILERFVEMLKEKKMYEDSLIIFTSDHGEEFFEHGGKEHGWLFVEHLHVPLLVKFPGSRYRGRRVLAPVRLVDVLPFTCESLGISPPDRIEGVSFLPLITGKGEYDPLIVSHCVDLEGAGYPVRVCRDGYAYSNEWHGQTEVTKEWLFDSRDDPAEQTNLASHRPKVMEKMRRLAAQARAEKFKYIDLIRASSLPDASLRAPGKELRDQLRSLGYIK